MNIALIAAASPQRERIFPPHLLDKLASLGALKVNPGGNDKDSVLATMQGADVVITSWGSPRMDAEYLDAAPDCKLILHAAGSVDPIVSDAVWARGIRVVCSSMAIGFGVAETALGLMISASKNFYQLNGYVHAGGWRETVEDTVVDLVDITVGIVGAGQVGRHLIKLLQPFEVDVVVSDPYITQEACDQLGVRRVSFEELLKVSDIVSIHAPSIPKTHHMFNKDTLALMKPTAGLINTARGSIINEQDLYTHMAAGKLRFACLDVTDPEPPVRNNPLRNLHNVILLPHIAGVVNNGLARIGRHAISELERFQKGEPCINEITQDMMFRVGKA